jgi:hypothetical protein
MSITVTEATITDVIDAALAAATAEKIINVAVDNLNILLTTPITRLAGTAGSMTATWTSRQLGAVTTLTRVVYASYYKNPANNPAIGIGSVSMSTGDLMSTPQMWHIFERVALRLNAVTDELPIYVGNAELPT